MIFPKKEFVMEPMGNLVLKDIEIHRAFSDERIKRLVSANHDIEKLHMELETIFSEFVDVYNYDKQTAVMPEPFGSFKDASQKQEWIENHLLALDFEYYMGIILYNYHDWLVDNGFPDIILGRLVTDYPNLYKRVVYDYISVLKSAPPRYPFRLEFTEKKEGARDEREKIKGSIQREMGYGYNKPYLAAYALPSLIEHFMIGFMQQDLLDKLIKDLMNLNQNGKITLDVLDMNFLKSIRNKTSMKDGSKDDALERCKQIFVNAGMNLDAGKTEVLLGKQGKTPMTFGAFLRNSYAQSHIKKPYYDVLEMLFSTKKVNLRNSIMHGASIMFDPYAMCFSAVLLQIFWGVIDKSIFT